MENSERVKKRRIEWLDLAKGLCIIFVVLGHSGSHWYDNMLSWFRMPLFFFLSGLLFKPILEKNFPSFFSYKMGKMLLPYFAYGLVIILIFYSNSPKAIYLNIQRLIIGGENLQGPLGVLWFISVLLVTQLVMGFISRYNIYIQLSIITLFYIVGHIIAMTSLSQIELPWKLSAVTGALFYYSMGYYLKNYIVKYVHNFKLIIPIFIFLIAFTFLYITLDFAFSINLKTDVFDSLILDAIIPILISFLICSLSFFLSKVKVFNFLKWLGRNSITIMYLHLPINIIIMRLLKSDYHDLLFVLFGVFISLAFGLILSKIKFTKHLFISPNISKNY